MSGATAAEFVMWAAEHIRAEFPGGQLTWAFVFGGLRCPGDHALGQALVDRGLSFWQRQVRVSQKGVHLYLYSLMAEGGLPEALLLQQGLYGRVFRGLISEIEAEGGTALSEDQAARIAWRRIAELPQTFQREETAQLLAGLALELAGLRAAVPGDLPPELTDRWLDANRPGWMDALPLRISQQTAEELVRRALRTERGRPATAFGPVGRRFLRRYDAGWCAVLKLEESGALPIGYFPEAEGLRLRLVPRGASAEVTGSLIYSAIAEAPSWLLHRQGGPGLQIVPWPLDRPFTLLAFADGKQKGEAEIASALPAPDEIPSLWCAADPQEDGPATQLRPLTGRAATRGTHLWLLAPQGARPEAGDGVAIEGSEPAEGGALWQISGCGELSLDGHRWNIRTGAGEESSERRLVAVGEVLPGWRVSGSGAPLYLGNPPVWGGVGEGELRALRGDQLRRRDGRVLWSTIVEWLEADASSLARMSLISVPPTVRITLRETAPGTVAVRLEEFPRGCSVRFAAGDAMTRLTLTGEATECSLAVTGQPPGEVFLHFSDLDVGAGLKIEAPWPARRGMLLSPDGMRVDRDSPLSCEQLQGWRAVVPEGGTGDLQFKLGAIAPVAVPVDGEVALAGYRDLLRAMLSQGGPDAQVDLRLVVDGAEGPRLQLRRYHDCALIDGDSLHVGLPRDAPSRALNPFSAGLVRGQLLVKAVNLADPSCVMSQYVDASSPMDLRVQLPEEDGPWLIQAWLDGRPQRAVVWSRQALPRTTREERVRLYATRWEHLLNAPEDPEWRRLRDLILAIADAGDAGVADQVQALGHVPGAVVSLALRAREAELAEILALDLAAPLFWPVIPVAAFRRALDAERSTLRSAYGRADIEDEADAALARRIGRVLALRPELAGHFGAAMKELGLPSFALGSNDEFRPLLEGKPLERLQELAQEAVRRCDRLPSGVAGVEPRHRPTELAINNHVQALVDSPLVAAELAMDSGSTPDETLLLKLINLRMVDPLYFDAALPAAVALTSQKRKGTS